MITGIMVYDETHKKSCLELVEEGRNVFKRRFKLDATHAVIPVIDAIPALEGMLISQQRYVRPYHVLVGVPVMAEPADRPHKTEEF